MMKLCELIKSSRTALREIYPEEEAQAIVARLAREVLGAEPYDHVIDPGREIGGEELETFESAMARLRKSEPLQYVLGHADFCAHRLKVTPSVLIPRPETEQLCHEVTAYARGHLAGEDGSFAGLKILDLCCGSGCIAWTLALALPGAEVTGVDISEEALQIARAQAGMMQESGKTLEEEARAAGCRMPVFIRYDILRGADEFRGSLPGCPDGMEIPEKFDVIASNPPYVPESERKVMDRNVLEWEPGLALFVPDEDPLKFFQKILEYAETRFNLGGLCMIEAHNDFCEAAAAIFSAAGMSGVETVRDFAGKFRFVRFENRPSK